MYSEVGSNSEVGRQTLSNNKIVKPSTDILLRRLILKDLPRMQNILQCSSVRKHFIELEIELKNYASQILLWCIMFIIQPLGKGHLIHLEDRLLAF